MHPDYSSAQSVSNGIHVSKSEILYLNPKELSKRETKCANCAYFAALIQQKHTGSVARQKNL
jgi:hypothetical protein